jgi:hypothetical protein
MTPNQAPELLHLRSFTDQGIDRAQQVLADLIAGYPVDIENFILDDSLTIVHDAVPTLCRQPFTNRFEAAKYFNEFLAPYESVIQDIERNRGLWTWLGFCWLDLLAPPQPDGSRKIGEWRKWILSTDRRHYRHLLATPYRIYRTHANDLSCVLVVLCGPVDTPGNITEQIASRQDIVKSRNIMQALTEMYYVPALTSAEEDLKASRVGQLRDGASTSAVRMGKVLGQFYLTWDMFAMEPEQIVTMLPLEFDKFKAVA